MTTSLKAFACVTLVPTKRPTLSRRQLKRPIEEVRNLLYIDDEDEEKFQPWGDMEDDLTRNNNSLRSKGLPPDYIPCPLLNWADGIDSLELKDPLCKIPAGRYWPRVSLSPLHGLRL